VRTRAVGALAYTPTRTARTYLMSLVRGRDPAAPTKPASVASKDAGATPAKPVADAGQTPDKATTSAALVLLRRAAVTLGWIGGPLAPPALAPLLEHADPDVRADAAVGLALTRLPAAAEILRARLARESDARVRGHISRQLSVIDTALAAPATPSR
ncbi:MAG TPA: HEAT repeat domain-containing protein, partial [Polyangia bacterium]